MLINSLLLTAVAAVSLLPGLVYAAPAPAPTAVYHEDGSVEIVTDSTDEDGNVVKRSVYFDFVGCDDSRKWDITKSWESMVNMGNAIQNKVGFDQPVCTAKSYQ